MSYALVGKETPIEPPNDLDEYAKHLFREFIKHYEFGTDVGDLSRLAQYVRVESDIARLRKTLQAEGDIVKTGEGNRIINGLLRTVLNYEAEARKLLSALNLGGETPNPVGRPPFTPNRR
jgi:hypothetical protein